MMAPSKKLLAALAAVFLLNILVIGGVQSLTTPALAAVFTSRAPKGRPCARSRPS